EYQVIKDLEPGGLPDLLDHGAATCPALCLPFRCAAYCVGMQPAIPAPACDSQVAVTSVASSVQRLQCLGPAQQFTKHSRSRVIDQFIGREFAVVAYLPSNRWNGDPFGDRHHLQGGGLHLDGLSGAQSA